jgi:hypothetical protein
MVLDEDGASLHPGAYVGLIQTLHRVHDILQGCVPCTGNEGG